MEFQDLQKVWQSQTRQPQYVFDESAIHKRVVSQHKTIQFMANVVEIGLLLVSACLVLFAFYKTTMGAQLHHWMTMFLFSGVAAYMVWDRRKRKLTEGVSNGSVLSDLDKAIRSLEHQITRQKRFVFWFLTPASIILLSRMITDFDGKPLLFWLVVPVVFVIIAWLVRWEIKHKLQPKLKDLKGLRKLLIEENV